MSHHPKTSPYNLTIDENGNFEFSINDPEAAAMFHSGARGIKRYIPPLTEGERSRVEHGTDKFVITNFGDHKNTDGSEADGFIRGKLREGVKDNEQTRADIISAFEDAAKKHYKYLADYEAGQPTVTALRHNYANFVEMIQNHSADSEKKAPAVPGGR